MTKDITFADGEKLLTAFSTHWIKYVFPTFLFVIFTSVSITLFIVSLATRSSSSVLAASLFFCGLTVLLFTYHWFFHKILSEAMDDVLITNKRIIFLDESLLFCDDMREIKITRLRAVEAQKHGLLQNIFLYGNLWFDTGGSDTTDAGAIIPLVPHPHQKAKLVTEMLTRS